MDYKIISADSSIGQIQVLYTQDGKNLGVYAIDVPIENGAFITGETLDIEIKHRAPTWVTERNNALITATGFNEIEALVQQNQENETKTEEQIQEENTRKMWVKTHFEYDVAEALVKFGLLKTNPMSLTVSNL